MLIDANLLLYATDSRSRFHSAVRGWLLEQLSGSRRVGLPWQSLSAFLHINPPPGLRAPPFGRGGLAVGVVVAGSADRMDTRGWAEARGAAR